MMVHDSQKDSMVTYSQHYLMQAARDNAGDHRVSRPTARDIPELRTERSFYPDAKACSHIEGSCRIGVVPRHLRADREGQNKTKRARTV